MANRLLVRNLEQRRRILHGLAALALGIGPPRIAAQVMRRDAPARVAILDDAPEAIRAPYWASFRRRLGEFGYQHGQNLQIDARFAGGDLQRLDGLAAELVALKPDVIVAVTTTAALAVKRA